MSTGIFVTESAGTPVWKLFIKRTQAETALPKFFSWQRFCEVRLSYRSSIIQTSILCTVSERKTSPPLSDRILGHFMRFGNYFFGKIALVEGYKSKNRLTYTVSKTNEVIRLNTFMHFPKGSEI
jgi:hypothetical protein